MGHQYIERLPRTRAWRAVVAMIRDGADAPAVADAVTRAARTVLLPLPKDPGVVEAVWHLIRLPIAAQDPDDFPAALRRLGYGTDDDPDLMDLLAGVSDALDAAVPPGTRTDLGEVAHTALVEVLADRLGGPATLFPDDPPPDVRAALAAAATVRRFGQLAAAYFARLVRKLLDSFVSRAVADHVGEGRRFRTLAHQAAFTDSLDRYAGEVAAGVDEYAGQWFAKWEYQADGRISRDQAGAFLAHAGEKLDWALGRG